MRVRTVSDLAEAYFRLKATELKESTITEYRYWVGLFTRRHGGLLLKSVKPFHMSEVVAEHRRLKPNSIRRLVGASKWMFSWAVAQGLMRKNPLDGYKMPTAERRDTILTDGQRSRIREVIPQGDALLDIWEFVELHGCRPQEARQIEAEHCDFEQGIVVLPRKLNKTRRGPRVIYLTERGLEICRRLARRRPKGPIFRNNRGHPWTASAWGARLVKLRKKCPDLPRDLCMYTNRHTFATNALARGLDSVVVAELLGHSSTAMLLRVYQHLARRPEAMRRAAERVHDSEWEAQG